jgi:hypothetical protein
VDGDFSGMGQADAMLLGRQAARSNVYSVRGINNQGGCALRFFGIFTFLLFVSSLSAQEVCLTSTLVVLPFSAVEEPSGAPCQEPQTAAPQQSPQPQQPAAADSQTTSTPAAEKPQEQAAPVADRDASKPPAQPKRILGVMPNFRAVSAGTLPPPPTPKQSLWIATQNSFDYSSFLFTGFTSLESQATNQHPQLGKGIGGYGQYYWRGFVDKVDGNYWVIFVLPTIFHQDERYYAMGKGGFWKRATYAASRVLITPNYQGHNSFNISELLGRGIAQGISVSYYPSQDQNAESLGKKYAFAIGRDALTNVFREFWPDIAVHVLHRKP